MLGKLSINLSPLGPFRAASTARIGSPRNGRGRRTRTRRTALPPSGRSLARPDGRAVHPHTSPEPLPRTAHPSTPLPTTSRTGSRPLDPHHGPSVGRDFRGAQRSENHGRPRHSSHHPVNAPTLPRHQPSTSTSTPRPAAQDDAGTRSDAGARCFTAARHTHASCRCPTHTHSTSTASAVAATTTAVSIRQLNASNCTHAYTGAGTSSRTTPPPRASSDRENPPSSGPGGRPGGAHTRPGRLTVAPAARGR